MKIELKLLLAGARRLRALRRKDRRQIMSQIMRKLLSARERELT